VPLKLSALPWPFRWVVIRSHPRAVAAKTKNEPALLIELNADGPASCGGERAFPTRPHDACTLLVGDDRDRCSWVGHPRTHDRLMRGSKGRRAEDCQYQHPLHVTAAVSALEWRPRWYVSSGDSPDGQVAARQGAPFRLEPARQIEGCLTLPTASRASDQMAR
jgi:hypothetical protein